MGENSPWERTNSQGPRYARDVQPPTKPLGEEYEIIVPGRIVAHPLATSHILSYLIEAILASVPDLRTVISLVITHIKWVPMKPNSGPSP